MFCPICHYSWCWACGLNVDSIVHRLQTRPALDDDDYPETVVCETIVHFLEVNKYKKIPYFLKLVICLLGVFLIIIVFPIILLAIVILLSPIFAFYLGHFLNCIVRQEKAKRILIALLLAPILLVLLIAGALIIFCLYYALAPIISIIYVFQFMFYKCLKSRSVKNKDSLEKMI